MHEQFVALQDSGFFRLQDEAYEAFGLASWTKKGVPYSLTNSVSMARTYATFIERRLQQSVDRACVLELGAGSGKLCFLILMILKQKLEHDQYLRIRYILSDKAKSVCRAWREHKQLKGFINDGVLELFCFDPLEESFSVFRFESSPFVIANYFFDTIEQALFAKKEGILYEGLINLTFEGKGPDALASVKERYNFVAAQKGPELYRELEDGVILWPIGAFRVLDAMQKSLSGFCLLIGDKGDHTLEHISKRVDAKLNKHSTFSFPVNFHALKDYAQSQGWQVVEFEPLAQFSVVSLQKSSAFTTLFSAQELKIQHELMLEPEALYVNRAEFLVKLGPKQYKKRVMAALELLFVMQSSDELVRQELESLLRTPVYTFQEMISPDVAQVGLELMIVLKQARLERVYETLPNQKFASLIFVDLGKILFNQERFRRIDEQIDSYSDRALQECIEGIEKMQLVSPELVVGFFSDLFERKKITKEQLQYCHEHFIKIGVIQEQHKKSDYKVKNSSISAPLIKSMLKDYVKERGTLIVFLEGSKNALSIAQTLCLDYSLSVQQGIFILNEKKILQIQIKYLH
jgi:hypothetical protein